MAGCIDCDVINSSPENLKLSSGLASWVKLHPCDIEDIVGAGGGGGGGTPQDVSARESYLTAGGTPTWDISVLTNVQSVSVVMAPNTGTVTLTTGSGAIVFDSAYLSSFGVSNGAIKREWSVNGDVNDAEVVAPLIVTVAGDAVASVTWTNH